MWTRAEGPKRSAGGATGLSDGREHQAAGHLDQTREERFGVGELAQLLEG